MALHAADVSNPVKSPAYYTLWTDRILQEFCAQGDIERSLGLDISPGFDREKCKTLKQRAGGQKFFIGVLVRPLYEAFSQLTHVRPLSMSLTPHVASYNVDT